MITVDPDIVGRLSSKAKDLNTGKGELEEYLKSHPVNPSNLLEPTFGTSDEDSERFKGRLTPRALDHPLNGIIERIPQRSLTMKLALVGQRVKPRTASRRRRS
jgi:hypothetical protein